MSKERDGLQFPGGEARSRGQEERPGGEQKMEKPEYEVTASSFDEWEEALER